MMLFYDVFLCPKTTPVINTNRKVNLLATDIQQYMIEQGFVIDNPTKCAWEVAKNLKDGIIMVDELDDAIFCYREIIEEIPQKNEIIGGNLSQTMRDLFVEKGMCINDIRKMLDCKYVRVKNVIKKLPDWKEMEIKNKSGK